MPAEGITPGTRECHDAQKGRRHVDWVYPEARPRPFALEVTSIVAAVDKKGESAAETISQRLTTRADAEELGAWLVMVDSACDLRVAEPEIAKILRDALPNRERLLRTGGFIRPGIYNEADLRRLPRREWDPYIAEHERVRQLGVVELKPFFAKQEHVVVVLPSRGAAIGSFSAELERAIDAKRRTLTLSRDLETHLGVMVDRWDVSNEPHETPAPELPPEVDVLWLVHRWAQELESSPVWVARRGDSDWRVCASSASGGTKRKAKGGNR